jgi:hypothetical protein
MNATLLVFLHKTSMSDFKSCAFINLMCVQASEHPVSLLRHSMRCNCM